MEKEKFRKLYEEAATTVDVNKRRKEELRTIDTEPIYVGQGTRNLIIVIEELAELQEQLVIWSTGLGERLYLIEEIADVYMAMDYVYMVCNIAEPEIPEQHIPASLYFNTTYNISILAKLQRKLSKYLRGIIDDTGILTEVTDALATLKRIKKIYHISDEEINKAFNVKLQRLEETRGVYK